MNRRDFFKVAGLSLVSGLVGGAMASYGELLGKMARGEKLSQAEASFVSANASRIDGLMGGQIGHTQPKFDFIRAAHGRFDRLPHDVARIEKENSQAVANATDVVVDWETVDFAYGDFVTDLSGDSIRNLKIGGVFMVAAFIQWDSNSSGHRAVYLRNNGSNVGGSISAPASGQTTIQNPFMIFEGESGDEWDVVVHQTSGSQINITSSCKFYMVRLR